MAKTKKATIVGGGLVGSLWALLLARRGYDIDVYERRDDVRRVGFAGGRSINLALSTRGWRALEKAGIKDLIEPNAIPMKGRMMHDPEGNLTFQPYGKEGQAIYSISRGGLNLKLIQKADEHEQVDFHFNQKCEVVNLEEGSISFTNTQTGEQKEVTAPLIFGADGAFSAIRSNMQYRPRFNYAQYYLDYGYKELTIPSGPNGTHLLDANALHIWPRGRFMLIALPNSDGSFTCTLFLPFEGKDSFGQLQTDEQVMAFFEKYFADVIPVCPDLLEDYHNNPTSSLVTIRCSPWHFDHRVLLMGDASHAIVPFYGQGMNAGFEDCSVLDELVEKHEDSWAEIIEEFNHTRIEDANAIADLAIRNFTEMRDRVADPRFLLRKEMEAYFHKKYPDSFIPVYSMVTFSHIPYHRALMESHSQDNLFRNLLSIEGVENNWKTNPEVEEVFQSWLKSRKVVQPSL